MKLTNELRLAVPIEEAWAALTDLERVAPCMPGAQLQEIEGDEYRGIVKVKVGAISAQYRGTARLVERDDDAYRAVLEAVGRDTGGQGNATARVTAVLTSVEGGTTVSLVTDLSITGKVAQFGRGVLSDITAKLLGQFAKQLEVALQSRPDPDESAAKDGNVAPHGRAAESVAPGIRAVSTSAAPVDLLDVAGLTVAKRVVPIVGVAAAVVLVSVGFRRRRAAAVQRGSES
jgi:uncharacterized protein